jgi:C1A family cysteine protease
MSLIENDYPTLLGASLSSPDLRDYKIAKTSLKTEFPETFSLIMPPVKSQGAVGACVANSIALCAEYFNRIQHGIFKSVSRGYIYGNRIPPQTTGTGMIVRYALQTYCKDGAPLEEDFSEYCEVPQIIEKVQEVKDQLHNSATPYRFTSYIKTLKENEIKTALMDGNPVIIAVKWYDDITLKDYILTSNYEKASGAHAIVIYGWNEYGWKIQNSWGEKWGAHGCAILPYDYPISEAFAIIDTETSDLNIDKPYSSNNIFTKFWVKVCNFFYAVQFKIKTKI